LILSIYINKNPQQDTFKKTQKDIL